MKMIIEIFSESFVQSGLAASFMIGGICAYLGVFLILKRIVFVGAAISQMAAAGIVVGHLIGHNLQCNLEWFSFFFAIAGVFIFWFVNTEQSITKESLIGYVYIFATGVTILIVAKDPMAEAENLDLFSGNILFVSGTDLIVTSVVLGLVFIVHMVLRKEFIFVSFDLYTAQTMKIPAKMYDFILYLTLGVVISVGIRYAGMLFIFSSLIIPAMIGLSLFDRLKWVFISSVISVWLSALTGIVISYRFDFPTGPAISVINAIILLICFAMSKFILKKS